MVLLHLIGLMALLLLGIAFVVNGIRSSAPTMTEYDIYGEQGEDEWARHAMGMTEEEYKEFMGEDHFNNKQKRRRW